MISGEYACDTEVAKLCTIGVTAVRYTLFSADNYVAISCVKGLNWRLLSRFKLIHTESGVSGVCMVRVTVSVKQCSRPSDKLNWTDLHQVDPVTRRVIGHARQRHEADWPQGCSSVHFCSSAVNTALVLCSVSNSHCQTRHDKTVLSVSCQAVRIESRDRLAKSEQSADRSPSSCGL